MAVKIQKQWGETAYFYPTVRNAEAAQIAVVNVSVGDGVVGASGTFEMPAGSENEYGLSGIVWGPIGIYDVTYRVAAGVGGWPILDERVYPGEFEVIGAAPPEETIEEQLASCWNYISGGGIHVDNIAIWANRNGVNLSYDSRWPDPNFTAFMTGDIIALYVIQQCTLVYKGRSWVLTPYYEPSFPDWITQIVW